MTGFVLAILLAVASARQIGEDRDVELDPNIPFEPLPGQRCAGRNYDGRRCCTPENPCDEGEGDCDGPLDGGGNDGHLGCRGDLVCGSNNCKKFGHYYHPKDDCCQRPDDARPLEPEAPSEPQFPNAPEFPPPGQRCSGRNYEGRRCCTPENPCNEGEGDCDGPLDGGKNDGHAGCKNGLICGSNNCKQFGKYFHEKDDCCERATGTFQQSPEFDVFGQEGWGQWESWSACSRRCGGGTWTRNRHCSGESCDHLVQTQNQPCNVKPC